MLYYNLVDIGNIKCKLNTCIGKSFVCSKNDLVIAVVYDNYYDNKTETIVKVNCRIVYGKVLYTVSNFKDNLYGIIPVSLNGSQVETESINQYGICRYEVTESDIFESYEFATGRLNYLNQVLSNRGKEFNQ